MGVVVKIKAVVLELNNNFMEIKILGASMFDYFLTIIANPNIAYILVLLGMYGLIYELANPGFIVPGVFGAFAFIAGIYAFWLLPINYLGVVLILLSMLCMLFEGFIRSFGILVVLGIVGFAWGSILLLQSVPGFELSVPLIVMVSIISAGFFFLVATMIVRVHGRPTVSGIETLFGLEGVVIKDENGARMRILGEIWQVRSVSALVNRQKVRVIGIDGLVLIVEPKINS